MHFHCCVTNLQMDDEDDLRGKLRSSLRQLSEEAASLYLGPAPRVAQLARPPPALAFHRDYVAHNRPVVVRGGVAHWPALSHWSPDYFKSKLRDHEVTGKSYF